MAKKSSSVIVNQFEDLAVAYARTRPNYPKQLVEIIENKLNLRKGGKIADIGAGTGLSSALFLERGYEAIVVDVSEKMLAEAKWFLKDYYHIQYVTASAEKTGLDSGCVTAVIIGQAFHWFSTEKAVKEFHRILGKGGGLALFWNNRDDEHSPFFAEFTQLIKKYNKKYEPPYRDENKWMPLFKNSKYFESPERTELTHSVEYTKERFLQLTESVSYIRNEIKGENFLKFQKEVGALMDKHFPNPNFTTPYVLKIYTCKKKNGNGTK